MRCLRQLPLLALFILPIAPTAAAEPFLPCSFNKAEILCKAVLRYDPDVLVIQWIDGKSQSYYGSRINNRLLTDRLGGKWRYMDFDMGRAWSLQNVSNGNIIIYNGTLKIYGGYF